MGRFGGTYRDDSRVLLGGSGPSSYCLFTFEWCSSVLVHSESVSGRPFGDPLANLTREPRNHFQFFRDSGGDEVWMASGEAFGCYLETLLAIQSCSFTVLFVVRR